MRTRLTIAIVLLLAPILAADPVITLPLDGYYRPGKFFPVHIASDKSVSAEIEAPGGVGARAQGTDFTLPVMLLSENQRSIHVVIDGKPTDLPIRSLEPDQKLLLVFASDFPTPPIVSLPGSRVVIATTAGSPNDTTQAYESADVVGMIASPAARRAPAANFVSMVPRQEIPATAMKKPYELLPCESLLHKPEGPSASLDDTGPYDAVASLVAARSSMVRQTLTLSMAAFAILVIAAALIHRRWAIYIVIAITVIWMIGVGVTFNRVSPITERAAIVALVANNPQRNDLWLFRSAIDSCEDSFIAPGPSCRPLFAGQADSLHMWVDPHEGRWEFHFTLSPGTKVGFFCRGIEKGIPPKEADAGAPRLFGELVRRYYLSPGLTADMWSPFAMTPEMWTVHNAR